MEPAIIFPACRQAGKIDNRQSCHDPSPKRILSGIGTEHKVEIRGYKEICSSGAGASQNGGPAMVGMPVSEWDRRNGPAEKIRAGRAEASF